MREVVTFQLGPLASCVASALWDTLAQHADAARPFWRTAAGGCVQPHAMVFDAAGSAAFRHRAAAVPGAAGSAGSGEGAAGGVDHDSDVPTCNWSAAARGVVTYPARGVIAVGGRSPTGAAWFDDGGAGSVPWSTFFDGEASLSHDVQDAMVGMLERCDNVQGAQVLMDVNSGFAGLGHVVAQWVREECPRAVILVAGYHDPALSAAIAPPAQPAGDAVPAYDAAIAAGATTTRGGAGGGPTPVGSLDIVDYGSRLQRYMEDVNIAMAYSTFGGRFSELGVHFFPMGPSVPPMAGAGVPALMADATSTATLSRMLYHCATWRRVLDPVLSKVGGRDGAHDGVGAGVKEDGMTWGATPDHTSGGDDVEAMPGSGVAVSTLHPPLSLAEYAETLDPGHACGMSHLGAHTVPLTTTATTAPFTMPLTAFYPTPYPAPGTKGADDIPLAWSVVMHDAGWPDRWGAASAYAATWALRPAAQRFRYSRSGAQAPLVPGYGGLVGWPPQHEMGEVRAVYTGGHTTMADLRICAQRFRRRDKAFDFRFVTSSGGGFSPDDVASRLADLEERACASEKYH